MKFSQKNIENWRFWKLTFYWVGHFEFFFSRKIIFFCFIPMKISHKLCVRIDGTQFLLLWWFTARNEHECIWNKLGAFFVLLCSEEVLVSITDQILANCTFVHRQLSLSQTDGYFISLLSFQTIARWSVPFRDFSGMAGKVFF